MLKLVLKSSISFWWLVIRWLSTINKCWGKTWVEIGKQSRVNTEIKLLLSWIHILTEGESNTCMYFSNVSEVAQSCLTLCNPMDCSPPGSSVHEIFQAWILEWVAVLFTCTILFSLYKNPVIIPILQFRKQNLERWTHWPETPGPVSNQWTPQYSV